ncbi:uncharacterized protein LOC117103660 [Anneissia japonica]|uniref:uncharacterized protein LOC117103660 n=1 Tax=Anneissia japonica TaxID=1529436 RepID=UPI001425A6AC|nr:uncharacterized protein LOC117103660 [Anneissia japonica]
MATRTQTTSLPPQYYRNQYQPQQQPGIIIAPNTAVTNVQTVNTASRRVIVDNKSLRTNSLFRLILGILIGIFGIVATCIHCNIYSGAGIWLGVVIGCFAIVGIGASSTTGSFSQKNCLVVTYHLSSIIVGLNALSLGIIASIAASDEPYYNYYYSLRSARVGIDITLAILSFAEVIAAIWAVVLTASATYCSRRETVVTTQPVVQYNSGATSHNTQYAFVNTTGPYPNQPYVHQHTHATTMHVVDSYNAPSAYPPPYTT